MNHHMYNIPSYHAVSCQVRKVVQNLTDSQISGVVLYPLSPVHRRVLHISLNLALRLRITSQPLLQLYCLLV